MANYVDAKKSIDNILAQLKGTRFFEYLGDWEYDESCGMDRYDFYEDMSIVNFFEREEYPDNIHYAYGACKMVIWDENDCEYVMKIARYDSDEYYCHKESEVYDLACMYGAEEAFAWCAEIYPAGHFGNKGIYAMEFVHCNDDEMIDGSYDYGFINFCDSEGLMPTDEGAKEAYSEYYADCGDDDDMLFDWAVSTWRDGIADMVYRVIGKYRINDLHAGNWGFRGNTVVMTDYSGY